MGLISQENQDSKKKQVNSQMQVEIALRHLQVVQRKVKLITKSVTIGSIWEAFLTI